MARLKDVVDECLTIAVAFTDISSSTYNELGAVNFEDNDKDFPLFLFDKRSVSVEVLSYTQQTGLPSKSIYTCQLHFMDTYTEAEKLTTDLQTKQDALIDIANKYLAELKTRTESGTKGFYVAKSGFTSIDETHNEQLIQLTYTVEFITAIENCTLGTFNY